MPPLTNAPGAAIYVRSNAQDARPLKQQELECIIYARKHGMTVDPEFIFREEADAGDHWSDRPAYSSLLLDAMRGSFSALVVSNTGVLESDPTTVKQLAEMLATNGVTLYSVH